MLTLEVGIPEGGMVTDRRASRIGNQRAVSLINTYDRGGTLGVRPGITSFGTAPDTKPVLNLFTAEFAGGTRTLCRIDEDKFYSWDGSAWAERMAGATVFTGSGLQPFGIAMCNNELVFAQGVGADKAWRWTGAGDIAQIANSGVFTNISFKYLTFFASRVIGANTTNANGAVEVVGSEPGSNIAWVANNGALQGYVNENPSAITGLSANDNELVIWKERAVVLGTETPDYRLPIELHQIKADGLGSVGQRCAAAFGGAWFNLSLEGFYILNSGVPQFIDSEIRRDFWRRVNRSRLAQIHSLVIAERGLIVWFIPEGSDDYPRAAWVWNVRTGGWDRWEFASRYITAAARSTASISAAVVDSYNDPVLHSVDHGIYSGTIVDSFVSTADSTRYILGDSIGNTYELVENARTDNSTGISWLWETEDIRWAGATDDVTRHTIAPLDLVTFTSLELEYKNSGADSVMAIQISTDSGKTWTNLTHDDGLADFNIVQTAGFSQLRAFGRVTGYWIRLRFLITAVTGAPEISDLRVFGELAGEVR